jgi:hypothetical protein
MAAVPARTCLLVATLVAANLCLLGFSPEASALLITGSMSAQDVDGSGATVSFNCEGQNPCRGVYADLEHDPRCSNILGRVDTLVISGMNLSAPGTISGTVTFSNLVHNGKQTNPDGTCSLTPIAHADGTFAFTGTWNGTSATLTSVGATDDSGNPLTVTGTLSTVSQLVQVSGSVSGTDGAGGSGSLAFECTGKGPCTGTYNSVSQSPGCSNAFHRSDTLALVGIDLSQPGPLSGYVIGRNLSDEDTMNMDGTCTITSSTDGISAFTGSWNGSSGTIAVTGRPISGGFSGTFTPVSTATTPPVFQMTVTAAIGATTSNASAQIQYRPQDVGTSGSVFVFAIAPSTVVRNAATNKAAFLGAYARGGNADTPVQCVLAQLNSSGQLQAVSTSALQAYITGVLGSQGQAVTILDGVPTANIGGATFYVGYGSSSSAMINSGINQRAVSVSAGVTCSPQPPETGWWWNTAEGGRGYSIEVAGSHIFFASYLYDVTGRSTWYVASGNTSLDGSLFVGNLEAYAQGQTLSSAYKAPTAAVLSGALTLAFSDARHGTMIWPGGTVAMERFNVVPNGVTLGAQPGQPESGWWFNPSEGGRGFFLEWQGGELFMAGYMYDDNGNPVWYLSSNGTPATNLQSYTNTWWQYANGQTLTGAFKPATQVSNNVGPVSITFQGAENAIMTLPGGATSAIRRFRF